MFTLSSLNPLKIPPVNDEVNMLGKEVEAELFRGHKRPIILIGFVGSSDQLVTVDDEAFINLWDYNL